MGAFAPEATAANSMREGNGSAEPQILLSQRHTHGDLGRFRSTYSTSASPRWSTSAVRDKSLPKSPWATERLSKQLPQKLLTA